MYVHEHLRVYVYMRERVHVYVYVHVYVRVRVYVRERVHDSMCRCVCICVCLCIFLCSGAVATYAFSHSSHHYFEQWIAMIMPAAGLQAMLHPSAGCVCRSISHNASNMNELPNLNYGE